MKSAKSPMKGMMKVILLERIPKLGAQGDTVAVKSGFARNFLIPRDKALLATAANQAIFEARRLELVRLAQERFEGAKARAVLLEGLSLVISAQASEEGKLFGSVSANDIVEAVAALGQSIDRHEIHFVSGPIRQIGDHEVELRLLGDELVLKLRISVVLP